MGLQEIVAGRLRHCQYQKLMCSDDKGSEVRQRGRWVKRANGRLKGIRISRSRKLTLRAFSMYLFPSRIARIYSGIVSRMNVDGICPAIVFSTHWGLPVLSHSSVKS
ncbi:hypothetical protein CDL15_Pgr018239 [Punica granatum]|uniref:Uncharacterized protein n=1 Tax=Punica granatum TaxID=22663 RepID=A0A218WHP1_PUNGR|nr:hypothetical protein CDL15_Pgr018239 [Punica granatum]PKI55519.1 hypothetical protein CRG98_024131 [Punica granatum]